MSCVNLMEQFGTKYRVGWDPARKAPDMDPWLMVMACERGEIYPHGGDLLVAEVDGRCRTRLRLRQLDCVTVKQDGDDFLAVTFHVRDFAEIAKILKPRRRRQLTEAQKQALVDRVASFRWQPCHTASQNGAPASRKAAG
jgi:hypothetical protein